jgi:hypothetical protein
MSAGHHLPSSGRALVPTASPPQSTAPHPPARRVAAFVAHLIATARHAPQTCERRRAEPAEVIAAYRAAVKKIHSPNVQ